MRFFTVLATLLTLAALISTACMHVTQISLDNGNDMSVAAWIEDKNGNDIYPETQHIILLLTMSFYPWELGVAKTPRIPEGYTLNFEYVASQNDPAQHLDSWLSSDSRHNVGGWNGNTCTINCRFNGSPNGI